MIFAFAGPSFQEGKGSSAAVAEGTAASRASRRRPVMPASLARSQLRLVLVTRRALMHLLEYLVDAEARGFLTWRIVLEGREEFGDIGLGRHHQEGVIQQPVVIGVGGDVGALEGIAAQVEELGQPQCREGLRPDPERAFRP